MLARLQKIITLTLLVMAFGWLAYFHSSAPTLAIVGFLLIAFGYAAFLAIEFLLLSFINKSDPTPQATWQELLRAWAGEVIAAPLVFCWYQPFRANAIADNLAPDAVIRSARRGVRTRIFLQSRCMDALAFAFAGQGSRFCCR